MANAPINKDIVMGLIKKELAYHIDKEMDAFLIAAKEEMEKSIKGQLANIVMKVLTQYSVYRDGSDIIIHVKNATE